MFQRGSELHYMNAKGIDLDRQSLDFFVESLPASHLLV